MNRSAPRLPPPRLEEVADGVFAYVQLDGGWCLNNAGAVIGSGDALVIDTAATQRRAGALRQSISRVSDAAPRIVVNTHHHGDHTFGNFLFVPDAVVIAHELCRAEMQAADLGMQHLWPDVEWGDIQLTLPSVTFRERLSVRVGDLLVELLHFGPAHTTNDVVVWIPDRGVLFVGDVVMSGVTPFCLMGSVEGSLRTVRHLRSFGARTVVCGHGPVAGPEVFDVAESYLSWIQRLARYGTTEGLSPRDLAKQADLGEFAGLLDSERVVGNLHRAYLERTPAPLGAPLDVVTIFQEMVEHHGRLPACWA